MKLRFDNQSMRIRVQKSDLEHLSEKGFVTTTIFIAEQKLSYRLELDGTAQQLSVQFLHGQHIVVSIPSMQAKNWIDSQEVGIYGTLPTAEPDVFLQLILEKDFPCKHGDSVENTDTFGDLAAL